MNNKIFQRAVSVLGVLFLLLGLMVFPPRGPQPSSAAAYDYLWRDDFATDTLHPLWSWVREDPTHWSLTDNPGFMQITTQAGGIVQTTNNQQNILVTHAPTGDFQITTKVTFEPSADYQVAAIHVYKDDDNFIQLNRGYTGGDAVNFDIEIGGVFTSIKAPETATTIWLRIIRELNTYSAFTSTDGAAWMLIGQHTTAALANAKVGLNATHYLEAVPEIPADFDYFELEASFPSFGALWNDDFGTDSLHPLWSWVREDPTHWSLTDNPGFMRIITQEGGIVQTTNNQQNILVTDAPTGDFQITTKVTFDPSANYQVAAIHVYQDDDNFIQLNRGFTGGNDVNFDIEIGGVFTSIKAPETATTIWLRIIRELNTYSAFTSTDGAAWKLIGQHTTAALANAKVGLNATHYLEAVPEIPADFDYFELERNYTSFLPLVLRNY